MPTKKKRAKAPKTKKAKAPKKSKCAIKMGRAGGIACKKAKKGIFAPGYKKRAKKKK